MVSVTGELTRIAVAFAFAGFAVLGPVSAASAPTCATVRDGFEANVLNTSNWLEKQLYNDQLEIQSDVVAEREGAVRLFVKPGDKACGGGCQRNEIRIANSKRCLFGDDVWYRFRFRIDGKTPSPGSVRWVIGQWKQESGGSPFLAQRFDNGVFHITVQHNDNRVLVTKAPGNPNARVQAPDQRGFMVHDRRIRRVVWGGIETMPINTDIDRGPHQVFLFRDRPLLPGTTATDITVELSSDPVLPDPKQGWVEMTYRVRGGRDGSGLIEIWANGVFKARVRGTIGNDDSAGPTQYFKFGHYRDIHDSFDTAHFYFDDFRRSRNRDSVFD